MEEEKVPNSAYVDNEVLREMNKREHDRKVQEKLALVDGLGADTYDAGTVLKFTKRLPEENGKGTYVALKSKEGRWHVTGSYVRKYYSWEEFLAWLVSGKTPTTSFSVMSEASQPAE